MIKSTMLRVQSEVLYASERWLIVGIKVANTPGVVADATADVGLFLLLGALRNFNRGIMELRRGMSQKDFTVADL